MTTRNEQAAADYEARLRRNAARRGEGDYEALLRRNAARRGEYGRQYRKRFRDQVLDHYGRACACCGTTENLSIDHVDGGGKAHRIWLFGRNAGPSTEMYRWLIVNGFPAGFQVLCRSCNRSKGESATCRLNHETAAA